jgi:hypothetical protein
MPEQLPLPALPELDPVLTIPAPKHDFYLAVVLDGVVYQTLNVDGQTAALYVAQPTFVQIDIGDAQTGHIYDAETNTFSIPTPE